MLSPFREQKLTYLFRILDFDHDGILQESDFISVGENIGIFRCLPPDSEIEHFIVRRSQEIWEAIIGFLDVHELIGCNLQNWLRMWDEIGEGTSERALDIMLKKAIRDIFYIFDKNLDNVLEKQEYLCLFVSLRVSIKAANFCFKTLDLNHDNLLSRDELFLAIKDFFLSEETSSPGNMIFGNPEIDKFKTRNVSFGM